MEIKTRGTPGSPWSRRILPRPGESFMVFQFSEKIFEVFIFFTMQDYTLDNSVGSDDLLALSCDACSEQVRKIIFKL